MAGIMVGTAALVIVLSAFNGMEGLAREIYQVLDPELKVVPKTGKTFTLDASLVNKLKQVEGVKAVTEVAEDNILAVFGETQMVAHLKGYGEGYEIQTSLGDKVFAGSPKALSGNEWGAIVGAGVRADLELDIGSPLSSFQCWYPKSIKAGSTINPESAFSKRLITPMAVFSAEENYDRQYIFVPIAFALDLFNWKDKRSSLEIKTKTGYDIQRVQDAIQEVLPENLEILNADEQHADLLRILRLEKVFVFVALGFILLISSFNIFVALNMLAVDKRKDLWQLATMGYSHNVLRGIFLFLGSLIAGIGSVSGLLLGYLVCWVQQEFALISMGMSLNPLDAYPIKVELVDFASIALLLVIVTLLASVFPAKKAAQLASKSIISDL